jgi:hypothetical protein
MSKKPTTPQQDVVELYDQLDSLNAMLGLFYDFKRFTIYKQIAVTLRLLLTGSSGDPGLVVPVLPAVQFLPLLKAPDPVMDPGFMLLPARCTLANSNVKLTFGNGRVIVKELDYAGSAIADMQWESLFDPSAKPLVLADWLPQPFLRPERTLGQFINLIANKDGGAHFDPNEKIAALQKFGNFQSHLICGIAKSVLPQITDHVKAAFPNHARKTR